MAKQDKQPKTKSKKQAEGDKGGNRYALYGVAGVGLLAVAGAGYFLYREKNVEKPRHRVIEEDGFFEVREYPELLVAEATVAGERSYALDKGFSQLADYIFAKSRDGEKVAMTAPVLSASAGAEDWVTRFVMPAHFTRETLPAADPGIRISTLPARKVAAVRFAGTADEATIADYEEQLRHWVGAKKLKATGEPERAFYNSPFIPGPLRRTEVLIPVA
ncbi:MAG TPA: heme-binding protein [Allosphingosinicella sp.]|nr:heme-binding protein [Allosphingosinicella sp.]